MFTIFNQFKRNCPLPGSLRKGQFYLKGNLLYLFALIALLIILNSGIRLVFLLVNRSFLKDASSLDLVIALLSGIRFDIATIFIYNLPFILLFLLPVKLNRITRIHRLFTPLFFAINLPIFVSNLIDIGYYRIAEKRLSYELYTMWSEILSFSTDALLEYYPLTLLLIAIGAIYFFTMRATSRRLKSDPHAFSHITLTDFAVSLFCLGVLLTGMRGGWQGRPLRPGMAFAAQNAFLGHVAGNSAYNLLDTVWSGKQEKIKLLPTAQAVATVRELIRNDFDSDFVDPDYPLLRKTAFTEPTRRWNVVILVLESMNAEYFGSLNPGQKKSLTPELDRFASKCMYFDNYYSNAKRSMEAFPAILNSTPDLFNFPIIGSRHEANATWGIGNILNKAGYSTLFFHGAHNGSLGLDHYSKASGFDRYYGMNEFGNPEGKWDGTWGVYDHHFMNYMYDVLKKEKKPYLGVFFSLSNHHPFTLPEEGFDDIKALEEPDYNKTVRYTDRVVANFMKRVEHDPDFQNTIFLITADHVTMNEIRDINPSAYFRVPLLIYAPGLVRSGINHTQSSHLDLLPTLIDLLKINTYHASIGISLLNPKRHGMLFRQDYGYFLYADEQYATVSNFMGFFGYSKNRNGKWDPGQPPVETMLSLQLRLSSLYQTVKNAIDENRLIHEKYRILRQ